MIDEHDIHWTIDTALTNGSTERLTVDSLSEFFEVLDAREIEYEGEYHEDTRQVTVTMWDIFDDREGSVLLTVSS